MLQTDESITPHSSAQPSIRSADRRSPTVPLSFSQADTVHRGRNHYTANTGGKALQSWRNSMNGFWHTPSFLSNEGNSSTTHGSNIMESSSPDKAISPPPNAQTRVPAVELPPRSFFDSDSESEGEPVLSRASTVRTQRPRLVEHNINAGGRSLRIYGGSFPPSTHPDPAFSKAQQFLCPLANPDETKLGPSISRAQQLLGIPLKNLADLTPAEGENPLQSPGGPAEALEALTANAWDRTSTTALAPTPPSQSDQSYTPTSTTEIPNTLANSEALSTLPSTGTLRVPCRHANLPPKVSDNHSNFSRQPEVLATNGLRSNPIRDSDISGLHRAISAPPPRRQVTIRPLDLETAGRHRLRQSVVSTPYPTKADRLAVRSTSPVSAAASARLSKARSPTSAERDRFPSPARPELLYLELAVARHHSMTTLVQVEVEDRSSYDDEALFKVIRKSYSQTLLGQARYLVTARAIRSVTFTDPIFDAPNFLQHLASPKLGHKRKTWLIWLREHQVTPNVGSSSSNRSENGVSLSSPISTPRMPFFKMHKTHPRVSFHFEFSLVRIALAVMGIMILSGLAVILWVLFGVPGSRLAQAQHTLAMPVEKWQFDAQRRVLTGLVLGVLVALLGTMGGVGWIVASWLLL